jgi:hypothetical protein
LEKTTLLPWYTVNIWAQGVLMMILLLLITASTMENANQDGVAFGESRQTNALDKNTQTQNELLSEARDLKQEEIPQEGNPIDADTSHMLEARKENKSDPLDKDKLVTEMTERGDTIVNDPTAPIQIDTITPQSISTQIYPCEESTQKAPAEYFFETLKPDIGYIPEKREKRCIRRAIKKCRGSARHSDDQPDGICEIYEIESTYEVRTIPYHESCSQFGWWKYDTETTVEPEKYYLRGLNWVFEGAQAHELLAKFKANRCSVVKQCIDGPATKTLHPTIPSVYQECWKYKVAALGEEDKKTNTCLYWRQQGCEEISNVCTKWDEDNKCLIYKKKYRCPTRTPSTVTMSGDKIHCIDGGSLIAQSPQFNDAAQALSQLAGLSEMQKEIQEQNSKDPMVFKGDCLRCKKNILPGFLYDCCHKLDGFAVKFKLTQCDDEEKALAARREKGHCILVGVMPNQLLDIFWKSSESHVYCCFPSRLSMILQREARKQLGITFGTPQQPDCGGLSMQEIARLDFSKMDLSELFDEIILNKAKPGNLKQVTAPTSDAIAAKMRSIKPPEKIS